MLQLKISLTNMYILCYTETQKLIFNFKLLFYNNYKYIILNEISLIEKKKL